MLESTTKDCANADHTSNRWLRSSIQLPNKRPYGVLSARRGDELCGQLHTVVINRVRITRLFTIRYLPHDKVTASMSFTALRTTTSLLVVALLAFVLRTLT
jgi:hypothetical protein